MVPKNLAGSHRLVQGYGSPFAGLRGFCRVSVLVTMLGVGQTSAAYADAAERLSDRLSQMQSFSASFHQRVEAESGQILETSEGVLRLRRPDRFFWQTFEPFPLIVYTDETSVYLYEQDLAQVTERDLEGMLNSTPAGVILTGGNRLAEQFEVLETLQSEDGVRVYSLSPLAEDAEFLRIELTFDESALESLFVEDILGNKSYVHFRERRLNQPIADERFEVAYPEGIDWVRQ